MRAFAAVAVVAVAPLMLLLPACEACDPVDAPGEGEGEGEGGGEAVAGDDCAGAIELVPDVPVVGDTTGAGDDVSGSCAFNPGFGPDLLYRFTLAEPSGVELELDTELDLMLVLFDAVACDAGAQAGCTDAHPDPDIPNDTPDERLVEEALPAGTYFVAVEGNSGVAGAFTLTLTLAAAACTPDILDGTPDDPEDPDDVPVLGDDGPAGATFAGAGDIDTATFAGFEQHLCPGDVDYVLVAHMGGTLDVDVAPAGDDTETGTAPFEVRSALVDAVASTPDLVVVTGEGDVVDVASGAVAPGYYLVRVSESGATEADAVDYTLSIAHECDGDAFDSPIDNLDDAGAVAVGGDFVDEGVLTVSNDIAPADAVSLAICNGDDDAILFDPLGAGDATVTLTGAGALALGVAFRAADGSEVSAANVVDSGPDTEPRTLTFTDLDASGSYVIRVQDAAVVSETVSYAVSLAVSYDAPANDLCVNAELLTASAAAPVEVSGSNAGAAHEMVGLCNGDTADPPAGEEGPEVFYALTVPTSTNLQIELDGDGDFLGTITMYRAPTSTCPGFLDVADLVAIEGDGSNIDAGDDVSVACRRERLRVFNVQPGDYLVVVEGQAGLETSVRTIPASRGTFTLRTQLFPDGFPPAEACTNAEPVTLPAPGASSELVVGPDDFSVDDELSGSCSTESVGQEKVFTFTPAAPASVTVSSQPADFDTVLYVRQIDCVSGPELACQDDVNVGAGQLSSSITFDVVADRAYFLVVDTFNRVDPAVEPNTTTVTISVAEGEGEGEGEGE